MRTLVLGGGRFAGRALVRAARARGWPVTVFNRGRTHLPGTDDDPEVERLRGDRMSDLGALAGREWDLVADTWSGAPAAVRDSARALAGRAGRYVYVSSCSVYAQPLAGWVPETAPTVPASPDDGPDVPYAQAKAGAEAAVLREFGAERVLIARSGLLVGPWEDVWRLPWWLQRIARGGDVPAPGPAGLPLQFIDVRDLAEWLLDAAERGLAGTYNAVGPAGIATMGEVLDACVEATGSGARLRWVPAEAVLAAGVEPWTDLPLWVPEDHEYRFLHRNDVGRALAAGLRCRPVSRTVADTWAWLRAIGDRPVPAAVRGTACLSPDQEAALLAAAS
ncbi:NAD-dependent epimerase/dehydratase family protein [Allonocardiopsis opalescens]|nr:NAD-dependent epimerase/dehydratase family protein [Allonocardiopsis opalescens]